MVDLHLHSTCSDGTDGPTDAAGGYVDGETLEALKEKGLSYAGMLQNHDAYHALAAVDGLILPETPAEQPAERRKRKGGWLGRIFKRGAKGRNS